MGDTVTFTAKGKSVTVPAEALAEMGKWSRACDLIGKEIGERLLIWVRELRENFKASAGNPKITLAMKPADAGEMPLVKIRLTIPKAGTDDEVDFDLNQLRLFDEVDD
jgi:hypothetical protein